MNQFLDIEVYPNYMLFAFKKDNLVIAFETTTKFNAGEVKDIRKLLRSGTNITFNGLTYDMPLIEYALGGADTMMMYHMSKYIIEQRSAAYMTYKKMGVEPDQLVDHIDIKEPAPAVMVGLKLYGARYGAKKLQDLPYNPLQRLNKKQMKKLKKYCGNDLDLTEGLYLAIKDRIDLRVEMSKEYGLDLRSKSDAQIAEAVITHKLGYTDKAPKLPKDYSCKYESPSYINFKTPQLQNLFKTVKDTVFTLNDAGQLILPESISQVITLGSTKYKMGIGGLHSQEKSLTVTKNMNNADFSSYYPYIILNNGYYPKHFGKKFLNIYRDIVETRIAAKKSGDKLVAGSYKIVINGSFGKLGSKYSKLYSPDLLLQVTITGQLTLLMIIEQFEAAGISVVSSNTDGLEYSTTKTKKASKIIKKLEKATGYEMDLGSYKGLHARDVNNYVANYGSYVKSKGVFADPMDEDNFLRKNVQVPICFEAVRQFILDGTPLKKTIKKCKDIKMFVSATQVNGGAWYGTPKYADRVKINAANKAGWKWYTEFLGFDDESEYLGKVVRWYYAKDGKSIHRAATGNNVPMAAGVKPMMTLSKKLPKDLNYDWYYDYANRMLGDLGHAKM